MAKNLYALLVGIDDYQPPVGRLQGCVNDVTRFQQWLEGRPAEGFAVATKTLTNAQATRQALIDGFQQHLSQAGAQDVALFYYSGHGSQERAPQEFWPIEPDHLDETLVCWDSRFPGGWDLADKELAALIAGVAASGAHVLVILDCCHSGSGTREARLGLPAGVRWTPTHPEPRPIESFIAPISRLAGREVDEKQADILLPKGRHVLLAACQAHETAKEYSAEGKTWGTFSYFLRTTLEGISSKLTYADLFAHVHARVRSSVYEQSPQLEAIGGAQADQPFLGGAVRPRPLYFSASHSKRSWLLDGGAIHGLQPPQAGETTALALFPLQAEASQLRQIDRALGQALVEQVEAHTSLLRLTRGALDPALSYKAVITAMPLPPLRVRLEGEDEGLHLVRSLLAETPSLFVAEEAQTPQVVLAAYEGQYGIARPTDDHPLAPPLAGYNAQTARQAVDYLEHIARWMKTADLHNPATRLPPEAIRMAVIRDGVEVPPAERLFEYRLGKQPHFELQLTNTSEQTLYCAVLGVWESFDIEALFIERLEAGQSFSQTIYSSVPNELYRQGITDSHEIYKLIACTEEFNPRLLQMGELGAGEDSSLRAAGQPLRSTLERLMQRVHVRKGSLQPEGEALADWTTVQAVVTVRRPLDTVAVPRQGEAIPLGWGVAMEPHPALAGRVRLAHAAAGGRDLLEPPLPEILRSDPATSLPFAFQLPRGLEPSPNMIELSQVEDATVVTPQAPLRLAFNTWLEQGEHVLAYGQDGEFFLPLGVARRSPDGEIRLDLQRLPPPQSSARDLKGAIRIYFQKVVGQPLGLPYRYPVLSAAQAAPGDEVTFQADAERVRLLVQQAKRITLYIHGLTGDTRSMLAQLPQPLPGELRLCFDYESFNTSFEDNARLLKQRLHAVGLGAGHGKQVRIVAHSLGGVLARCFIEREGGREIVQKLVTLGAPHAGTPWSMIQEWATLALGLALNSMTTLAWPLRALSLLLGWFEQNDVTLDQIKPGSDLLQSLNSSEDPHLPYLLLAGNTSLAVQALEGEQGSRLAHLLQRLGYGAAALAFFGQPNDTAVSVASAWAVPAGRTPQPACREIACDHISFFDSPEVQQALADLF